MLELFDVGFVKDEIVFPIVFSQEMIDLLNDVVVRIECPLGNYIFPLLYNVVSESIQPVSNVVNSITPSFFNIFYGVFLFFVVERSEYGFNVNAKNIDCLRFFFLRLI